MTSRHTRKSDQNRDVQSFSWQLMLLEPATNWCEIHPYRRQLSEIIYTRKDLIMHKAAIPRLRIRIRISVEKPNTLITVTDIHVVRFRIRIRKQRPEK